MVMPLKTPKTRKTYAVNVSMDIMERVRTLSQKEDMPVSKLSDAAYLNLLGDYARKDGIEMMNEDTSPRETKYVLAVANHKGGVGKTTTTAALAYLFAKKGKMHVCLIDADAQINLTQRMQAPMDGKIDIKSAVLSRCAGADVPIGTFIVPTQYKGIDMIPGNLTIESDKFNAEIARARVEEEINPWVEIISDIKAMNYYDIIMVDTHPSIGTDTLLPMQACDDILVPMEPAEDSVAGLFQVYQNIQKSRRRANPDIRLVGCFFNRVKQNTSSFHDYLPSARKAIPEAIAKMNHDVPEGRVFKTTIRDSEDARKASNYHCAVTERFRNKKVSRDFDALYDELMEAMNRE